MSDPSALQPMAPPQDKVIQRVELIIARLLRWGVLTSLALILAGTLASFLKADGLSGTHAGLTETITHPANFPHTFAWVWEGVMAFHGETLIVLGLMLLIATPLLRVAVSIFAYAIERDVVYVLITSVVLGLLVLSILVGKAG